MNNIDSNVRPLQVYDAQFSKNLRFDGQQWRVPVVPLLRRSTSDLLNFLNHDAVSSSAPPLQPQPPATPLKTPAEETGVNGVEYDEIDQIYDYIRGFAPLPKHLKNVNVNVNNNRNLYKSGVGGVGGKLPRPAPPPLETMPSRKVIGAGGGGGGGGGGGRKPETVAEEEVDDVVVDVDRSSRVSANHSVTIAVSAPTPVLVYYYYYYYCYYYY